MILAHAIVLADARSAIATLAELAHTTDASIEYERALLQLDWLHESVTPGITLRLDQLRGALFDVAEQAVYDLTRFGIDNLELDLVIDILDVARDKDAP